MAVRIWSSVITRMQVLEAHAGVVEMLDRFTSCKPSLDVLLTLLPPLQPRMYSVTNSGKAVQNRAEVALSVVRFPTPYTDNKRGVASTWLDETHVKQVGLLDGMPP